MTETTRIILAGVLGVIVGAVLLQILPSRIPALSSRPSMVHPPEEGEELNRLRTALASRMHELSQAPARAPAPPPPRKTRKYDFESAGSAMEILRAHDPHALDVLPAMERALMTSQALKECGLDFARRKNRRGWAVQTECALDLRIEHDAAIVTNAYFPDGDEADVGDSEFQNCLTKTLKLMTLSCEGCRSGKLTFPWAFQIAFNLGHDAGVP